MSNANTSDILQSILNSGNSITSAEVKTVKSEQSLLKENLFVPGQNHGKSINSDKKPSYPSPSETPTQIGPEGIRYDFNHGVRVQVPVGEWRVRFTDLDTSTVFFDGKGSGCIFQGRKKHCLRIKLEVFQKGLLIFSHIYDASNRQVAVILPGGTVGDSIGWFPYAVRFCEQHKCQLVVMLSPHMKELLEPAYLNITFVEQSAFDDIKDNLYATYYMGLFFHDEDNTWQPVDFRLVGLHRTAGYILGVSPIEEAPRLVVSEERPISEPYVVIATQASTQCKYWNNPYGWYDVVEYLKRSGYRVICIDKDQIYGQGLHWNQIPHGAEDQTGARPLSERAWWLAHAEFFVGLSSGLSWLAWAAQTPVVMISGFTHPINEFETPYRVFNTNICNSCWHDIRHPFVHDDFLFCPRHSKTDRQFECTQKITSEHVIENIKRVIKSLNN